MLLGCRHRGGVAAPQGRGKAVKATTSVKSTLRRIVVACLALALVLTGLTVQSAAAATNETFSGEGWGSSDEFTLTPGKYSIVFTYSSEEATEALVRLVSWEIDEDLLELSGTKGTERATFTIDEEDDYWFEVDTEDEVTWKATLASDPVKKLSATPKPKITGTTTVGKKLTAKPGTWKPTGVNLTYQWLLNGSKIKGATKSTYTLTGKDKGKKIGITVTGAKPGYKSVSKTSANTKAVKAGKLTAKTPKITGSAKVGKKLTAKPGSWKPSGVKFTYQWLRNGSKINGATKSTYTLTSKDKGQRVSVRVKGSKSGYTTVSKTSSKTRLVTIPSLSRSQQRAVGTAKSYLEFMAFSRSGLIDQLEYEGYSTKDATIAVDSLSISWKKQAVKMAKSYLEFMDFSLSGLIDQLEFEGFTPSQAEYGAEKAYYA